MAVKAVFKDRIDDGIRLSKVSGELDILRRLKHPNLVELIEEFDSDNLHCSIFPVYMVRHIALFILHLPYYSIKFVSSNLLMSIE